MRVRTLVAAAGMAIALVGCTHYYQVTDTATGRTYYTTNVTDRTGGAVTFNDARFNDRVNLQNSEIREITQKDFQIGKNTPMQQPVPAGPSPAGATLEPVLPIPEVHDHDRDDSDVQDMP